MFRFLVWLSFSAVDLSDVKCDFVYYYRQTELADYEGVKDLLTCQFMRETMPELGAICGKILVATKDNLHSQLAQSKNYWLAFPSLSLDDQVKLDFSKLSGRKTIFLGQGSEDLKRLPDVVRSVNRSLSALRNFAIGKTDTSSLIQRRAPSAISPDYPITIDSGPASHDLVDQIVPLAGLSLASEFSVQNLVMYGGKLEHPERMKADYVLTHVDFLKPEHTDLPSTFNDLGVMVDGPEATITFYDGGWRLGGTDLPKSKVKGKLSVLFVGNNDVTVNLVPSSAVESSNIQGLTISVQSQLVAFPYFMQFPPPAEPAALASPKLIVKFHETWDTFVKNTPTIIFEAESTTDIDISPNPQPQNVITSKAVVTPGGGDPSGEGNPPGDGNGKSGDGFPVGGIIGIVVGVVAVVGVVGFCVYWFGIRPSGQKGQVENAKPGQSVVRV
jgi:hypothetical protein